MDVDGCFIRDDCDNTCRGGRGRTHIERSADAMLIGIDGCLDGIGIIASRSTVCRKIVRRTPASARGTADTEPTCDAGRVEQRQRSALCCRIDYSITGRGGFADIERTRSDGHCAGASAGSHRNVLSHDIARGALEGGLEPIVLATHSVDGEGVRVVLSGIEASAEEPVLQEERRFRLPPTTLPVKDAIIKSPFS